MLKLFLVPLLLSVATAQIQTALSDVRGAIADFDQQVLKFNSTTQANMSSALKCGELSLFAELSTLVSSISSRVSDSKPKQVAPAVSQFTGLNSQLVQMLGHLSDLADTFKETSLQSLMATQVSALSFPMYELNSLFLERIYWVHNSDMFNTVFSVAYSAASAMADAARTYTADVPRFAVESKGAEGHFVYFLPGVPARHTNKSLQLDKAMPLAQQRCDNILRLLHSRREDYNSTDVLDELSQLSETYMSLRDLCKRQMHRNLQRNPKCYVSSYNELASSLSLIIAELDRASRDDYRLSTELTVLSYPVRCFSHKFLKMVSEINCKYFMSCMDATKTLAATFEQNSNAVFRMDLEMGRCTKLEVEWEQWGRWLCMSLLIFLFLMIFAVYLVLKYFKGVTEQVHGLMNFLNEMKGTFAEPLEAAHAAQTKFITMPPLPH